MTYLTLPLSADGRVTLTAYLHTPSPEMADLTERPAVLVFPGGGYCGLSDRENEPIALSYLARGYHAFVLRYSVGAEHSFQEALHDADEALRTIRSHAAEWHVLADKIAVCGFSAGGHLAAASGTMGQERPNALILAYPCILGDDRPVLAFPVPSCSEAVDEQTPPAFLFHTRDDQVVPVENSLQFAAAMDRAGRPFEMHIFRHGPHGVALANHLTESGNPAFVNADDAQWLGLSVAWLDDLFGMVAHA